MIVAALVVTVAFSAAWTWPGNYNGIAKKQSDVFVVTNAMSFFASLTSVLVFIYISTLRFAENDFLVIIPVATMTGTLTLYVSLMLMTIAFTASLFTVLGTVWVSLVLCGLASLPTAFSFQQGIRLFWKFIMTTYNSRYLFRPINV